MLESAGVRNVLTKCQGTRNPHNVIKAVINALEQMQAPEDYARARGKEVGELAPTAS